MQNSTNTCFNYSSVYTYRSNAVASYPQKSSELEEYCYVLVLVAASAQKCFWHQFSLPLLCSTLPWLTLTLLLLNREKKSSIYYSNHEKSDQFLVCFNISSYQKSLIKFCYSFSSFDLPFPQKKCKYQVTNIF